MRGFAHRDAARMSGPRLYARSRGTAGGLVVLACAAPAVAWLSGRPELEQEPTLLFGPLVVAAVVVTGLRPVMDELDRTAARSWWPLRLAQFAALSALGALALAAGALGAGAPAVPSVRNALGAAGCAALAAVALGARAGWLAVLVWLGGIRLSEGLGRADGGWADALGWAALPGERPLGWAVAVALFAAGAGCHARWGTGGLGRGRAGAAGGDR
ncbi:hypothetical protein JNUCC64_31835 [Streptomyces sp. JNUCC 64]